MPSKRRRISDIPKDKKVQLSVIVPQHLIAKAMDKRKHDLKTWSVTATAVVIQSLKIYIGETDE